MASAFSTDLLGSQQSVQKGRVLPFYRLAPCLSLKIPLEKIITKLAKLPSLSKVLMIVLSFDSSNIIVWKKLLYITKPCYPATFSIQIPSLFQIKIILNVTKTHF